MTTTPASQWLGHLGARLIELRSLVAHFELRPMDRTGLEWQLSWRDLSTAPPAYSGAVRGTLQDVVVQALEIADNAPVSAPTPSARKQKVMTRR